MQLLTFHQEAVAEGFKTFVMFQMELPSNGSSPYGVAKS
jgi:hypothetical protein